jgi:pimeloyl-ACP methyl ester carboxylesterase
MRRIAVGLSEERSNGPDAEQAFLEAARSLAVLVTRSGAYRQLLSSVTAPGIVLQGELDRLVPVSGVAQLTSLQPDWTLHLLDGVGHVPQIEAPRLTADLLLPWLSALPLAAHSIDRAPDLTDAGPDLLAGAS